MFKKQLLLLTAFTVVLFSCKKDDSASPAGDTSKLIGTWTFINMTAHTNATDIEVIDGDTYKSVSISDYTSTDNAGLLIFDASTMAAKDFTYSIDAYVYGTTYINGVSQGTESAPYQFTSPVGSSLAPYKVIGADSIYVSVGTVTSGATTVPSTPAGMKFSWSGDTLLLKSSASEPATAGHTGTSTQVMRYIKKN